MTRTNLNPTETELIKSYLMPRLAPYLLVLFGSAAHGRLRQDSDIDLAFLSDQPHDAYDIFMIAQGLADNLGREVDLVDLAKVSTVFKAQVFHGGVVLIDNDPARRMRFHMMAFKEYVMLNEERQEILKRYSGVKK